MKNTVKEYAVITLGMAMVAAAIYFFMLPGDIVMGSVAGLALLLVNFIPVSVSVMTLILNVLCVVIGFLLIGKEFGTKTVYASVIMPVLMFFLEILFPEMHSLTDDVILDVLCLILIISMGQVLMFQVNASSGGLDIIAKVMNQYFHIDLGNALAIAGGVIICSSIFVYDTKTLIVGALGTYFNGIVVDAYLGGFSRKKKVCVISDRYEKIQQYIIHDISRGATLYPARGGYENKDRVELVTILNKNEYGNLMAYIGKTDPNAFVTVSAVSEVIGMWNRSKRKH